MHEIPTWQKSSYSSEGNNCLELASGSNSTLLLRESEDPSTVLATSPARLSGLLKLAKTHAQLT